MLLFDIYFKIIKYTLLYKDAVLTENLSNNLILVIRKYIQLLEIEKLKMTI